MVNPICTERNLADTEERIERKKNALLKYTIAGEEMWFTYDNIRYKIQWIDKGES